MEILYKIELFLRSNLYQLINDFVSAFILQRPPRNSLKEKRAIQKHIRIENE